MSGYPDPEPLTATLPVKVGLAVCAYDDKLAESAYDDKIDASAYVDAALTDVKYGVNAVDIVVDRSETLELVMVDVVVK